MDAKLQAKYDYASCTGLRNRGSKSLNTAQYGWDPRLPAVQLRV